MDQSRQSIVIVVSPLIALMKDQVTHLTEKGVNAAYVKGDTEGDSTLGEELHEGQYQVVFSPETLLRDETWRDMLQSESSGFHGGQSTLCQEVVSIHFFYGLVATTHVHRLTQSVKLCEDCT